MADGFLDAPFDLSGKRIFVAGHNGMVGAVVCRRLSKESCEILHVDRAGLDLRNGDATREWMATHKPDVVVLAAAKVGGIMANKTQPADFLHDNLLIQSSVMAAAHKCEVKKLLFLGSSCIYPRDAAQPISEDALMSGPLESTNEAYATAKIAGIRLAQSYRAQYGCDFISAMPCNLYGPGDTYDEQNSHVVPALLMKAHEAKARGDKALAVWGSGKPLREFLYVEDLADALVFLLKQYSDPRPINVGSGKDISIADLARMICDVTGFDGEIVFDPAKPDGTPRKVLDVSRMQRAGWAAKTSLPDGLRETYDVYAAGYSQGKAA